MSRRCEIGRIGTVLGRAHALPSAGLDFLAGAPAAWRCDLADESLNWDDGVFDLFGIAPGTHVTRPEILDLYCAESRDRLEQARNAAIRCCGSFSLDARIRRIDGALRWIRIHCDVVSRGGRAISLQGWKKDITTEAMLSGLPV